MSTWFRTYGLAEAGENLLVGALPSDAGDVALLARMGVRRVMNLVEDPEYSPGARAEVAGALRGAGIEEDRRQLTDFGRLDPEQLEGAVSQVVEWLEQGERVYVHCRAGRQRSAGVVAGVIAITEGLDIREALEVLSRRKPTADPLPHQRQDLIRWWEERGEGG